MYVCMYVCMYMFQGEVEAYGSYASLLATGFDTARLLGLVSANEDEQTKREPTSK